MAVIGVDIGGTKIASAVFDENGKILMKDLAALEERSGSDVGSLIKERIKVLQNYCYQNNLIIESIGACVPGISWRKTGKVWAPNIPGWEDYPLKKEIEKLLGEQIPVTIDSDRACYILGEAWIGAAKDVDDAIFLAVGTGIGAGIFSGGRVIRGANDIAGAIGWLALNKPYLEKYESCGNFEYYASGEGLIRAVKEFLQKEKIYNGILNRDSLKGKDIFTAYDEGDSVAKKVIDQAVEYWGMASANLVSLFNPEKIIFGGGVFGPGLKFLSEIKKEAEKWAQPIAIKQVEFLPSELKGDAGLYGAGYLALRNK